MIVLFRTLIYAGLFFSISTSSNAQSLSPEMRQKFMVDQDAYFVRLNLHENQKRNYEEITRRYDKQIIKVEQGSLNNSGKRKKIKSLERSKNTEMKLLLTTHQYKAYLARQKEIATIYRE